MDAFIGGCKFQELLHKVYNVCLGGGGSREPSYDVWVSIKGDPISSAVCYTISYSDSQEMGFRRFRVSLVGSPLIPYPNSSKTALCLQWDLHGLASFGGNIRFAWHFCPSVMSSF